MKDTRLIRILSTFSKDELKSFQKFLESPFLKPGRNTVILFEYIIKFHPEFDDGKIEKQKVFKKLFKDETYSEKKMLNLIYDLTKTAENFIAYNAMINDETEYLFNLSKGYVARNLHDESYRVNRSIEKTLKPGFSPMIDYISKLRRLTYLKSLYFTQKNDFENLIKSKNNYFEASAIQFIIDFSEIVSVKKPALNTYGNKMENMMVESITKSFDVKKLLTTLESADYDKKSLISLHYYILKTNEEPDNKLYFYKLRDVFYESLNDYDRGERCLIFSNLVNYCVQRSVGNVEFRKEGLEVYKKMITSESYSFLETEYIDVITYRNIIQYCISQKDSEWMKFFLDNYSDKVQPDLREDLKNLSYGNLNFIRKEFEKALDSCSKINSEFFLFKTDLKNLMLKIYYELKYYEPAFSMIDSYKHFLSNTKEIMPSFKTVFGNFVKHYNDLLRIKSLQSTEDPLFIRKRIEKEEQVVNKSWLLEKAQELTK